MLPGGAAAIRRAVDLVAWNEAPGDLTSYIGGMCRLILASLLGLRIELRRLHAAPCPPARREALEIHHRCWETVYHIAVAQAHAGYDGEHSVPVDGVEQDGKISLWSMIAVNRSRTCAFRRYKVGPRIRRKRRLCHAAS